MFSIESLKKYKGLIGSTKESIDAIQKFIEKNKKESSVFNNEEEPASSINKVLNAALGNDIDNEIKSIINNL